MRPASLLYPPALTQAGMHAGGGKQSNLS